jgi:hypothetical protein
MVAVMQEKKQAKRKVELLARKLEELLVKKLEDKLAEKQGKNFLGEKEVGLEQQLVPKQV